MSCIQATTTYRPRSGPVVRKHQKRLKTVFCASLSSTPYQQSRNIRHAKLVHSSTKYKRLAPVCGISGAGSAGNSDDPFSMESLKKAMEGLKQEKPLQDVLKEKLRELNFGGDGGAGKRPPRGGGGGGGAQEGSGEDFKKFQEWLDEVLQVFLATIGLITVYIYIVRGEELFLVARDYIKYLIWGKKSNRLAEFLEWWEDNVAGAIPKLNMQMYLDTVLSRMGSSWHKTDIPEPLPNLRADRKEIDGEEGEDGDEKEYRGDVRQRLDRNRNKPYWAVGDDDESDNEESDK